MEFWTKTNWFAIQAKPHRDDLAAAGVRELDIEVFAPRIKVEQQVCGTWRWVTKPLFPSYFFARFCPLVSIGAVRFTAGILRVVGGAAFPTSIEPAVIEALRETLDECGSIERSPADLTPGTKVTIESGPFMGWAGRVLRESDDRKRVTVLLDLLEHARVVTERRCLQLAQS